MSWTHKRLGDLLEHCIGGVWGEAPGVGDLDVHVWRVTELKTGGRLDPSTAALRSVSKRQYESRALRVNDLLLEKSGGGPKSPVGRVGLVKSVPSSAVCANFMQLLRPRPGLVDARFLHLYLNYFHLIGGTLPLQKASTNIRNIKTAQYLDLSIPLPGLSEQQRIVDILEDHLSRLDAADSALDAGDSRSRALELSALDKHFGAHGAVIRLGELVADITAGRSFGSARAAAAEDEWGIVKVSAMTWGSFKAEENKAVPPELVDPRFEIRQGDLLVSRANTSEYVGASVLVGPVRPRLLLSDKSLRLTPHSSVNVEWLWRALQAPSARRQISALATGTKDSMRNISQSSLRQILLPAADPAAQEWAVHCFAGVKGSVAAVQSSIAAQRRRSSVLRRSLLAAAFSGRLTGRCADVERVEELAGV